MNLLTGGAGGPGLAAMMVSGLLPLLEEVILLILSLVSSEGFLYC